MGMFIKTAIVTALFALANVGLADEMSGSTLPAGAGESSSSTASGGNTSVNSDEEKINDQEKNTGDQKVGSSAVKTPVTPGAPKGYNFGGSPYTKYYQPWSMPGYRGRVDPAAKNAQKTPPGYQKNPIIPVTKEEERRESNSRFNVKGLDAPPILRNNPYNPLWHNGNISPPPGKGASSSTGSGTPSQ